MSERLRDALLVLFAIVTFAGAGYVLHHGGRNGGGSETITVQPSDSPSPTVGPTINPTSNPTSDPTATSTTIISSLWSGDGYTEGLGAGTAAHGEACLTAKALGWTCKVDAVHNTGFVNAPAGTQTIPDRLTANAAGSYDVIVVDGGRADAGVPQDKEEQAVGTYVGRLHDVFPQARIVLIAPYFMSSRSTVLTRAYVAFLRQIAPLNNAVVVDPIGEGWIGTSASAQLIGTDKIDPSPAGHQYISTHLVADFKRLKLPA